MGNFPYFNVGDYIDILITAHVKCLHMNYDNLFMFQLHPRSLKQVFSNMQGFNVDHILFCKQHCVGTLFITFSFRS